MSAIKIPNYLFYEGNLRNHYHNIPLHSEEPGELAIADTEMNRKVFVKNLSA